MRVDLFSTIHKAVRSLLFELSADVARLDVTSTAAVDGLCHRVDRVLAFLDEHAGIENTFIVPLLHELAPELAADLAREHRALDAVQIEVALAADAVAIADLSTRPVAGAHLVRVVNHLVAVQLIHMNREETEVNYVLWDGRTDTDLVALRGAMTQSLPNERRAEWMAIMLPALSPVEQRLIGGARV
jgi:hypothetical protein